jgi:flagellin FlaB
MRSINRNDAFTGLEAAIVLIAFVVVAAVFAYVVLGAGFFTTQKSQEVVHTGVQQASTNLAILGEVYGDASGTPTTATAPGRIHTIIFSVSLAAGGTPVDMNKTTFVYSNATTLQLIDVAAQGTTYCSGPIGCCANTTYMPGQYQWMICSRTNADSDTVLERDEKFTIWANLSLANGYGIPPRDDFTLEIKPEMGASLGITRTAPAAIDNMNLLY